MPRLRRLVPLLLCLLLAWTGVIPVQAHAVLVRSIPPANASLVSAPPRVELFFSEAVDARLSKIDVLDTHNHMLDAGMAQIDPTDAMHLSISLPPLPDGVYIVSWSMVSATDGHQTSGSFPFAVGKVAPGALSGSVTPAGSPPMPVGMMVMKGLLYLAAAALMGRILFTLWVWRPALRRSQILEEVLPGDRRKSRALVIGALLVLVIADLLSLMLQAGQDSGTALGWPWQPTFLTILFGTRVGALGIARLIIPILLAWLLLGRPDGWKRWAGLGVCLVLMLTFSLESHAAADVSPALPLLADWVHMLGVSIWVGGLFSFLAGMWLIRPLPAPDRTRLTAILIPRFSSLALTSVAALGVTGLYAAVLRLGAVEALWTTTYGQALVLKLVIAIPMVGLGAVNFLFTTPNMRRAAQQPGGNPAQVRRFSRLLGGEVVLGVLILIWVGVFTSLAPARSLTPPAGFQAVTQADDLKVALAIDPAQAGINTFTATISAYGLPPAKVQEVSLEFTSLSGMIPPAKAAMTAVGPGLYRLSGGYLAMPEKWDVKVVVIRVDKFDAYADFKIDLTQSLPQALIGK